MHWLYGCSLLSSSLLTLSTMALLRRHVGESFSQFRQSFQPDGRYFVFQALLFASTFSAAIYVIVQEPARFDRHFKEFFLFSSSAWICATAWIFMFDNQQYKLLSAIAMLLSFSCSVAADVLLIGWGGGDVETILLSVPNSLLLGYLLLATAVSICTIFSTKTFDGDEVTVDAYKNRSREKLEAHEMKLVEQSTLRDMRVRVQFDMLRDQDASKHIQVRGTQVAAFFILSFILTCYAFFVVNPVVVLPLVYGVILQRGFPRSIGLWVALIVLMVGIVLPLLRVFTDIFPEFAPLASR